MLLFGIISDCFFTYLSAFNFSFLGAAIYAKYLNLVPGVAVSNVVANASAIDLGNATTILTEQNATVLVGNRSLSAALNETANVLLDVSNAEDNIILWLPLTLLLLSALLAHVGIIIIPWMLIGEVWPLLANYAMVILFNSFFYS